jgi:F-type H+-transporting ATPase subunit b
VESEGGLPQLNSETYASQVFWLLIAFGLLYLLMSRIFLPRLGGVIEERRQRIADDYDKAAEFKRQAEEAEASYKQALADARARASRIAQETKEQLDEEIKAMQAETDRQLEADITAAEARIAETSARAQATVREAARATTREIVMTLIDETPSDEAVDAALNHAAGGRA